MYLDRRTGAFRLLAALKEAMWHSVSHVLSFNVFVVNATPARIVVAAYAFMVLIISSTYLANLAAFLTVDQLDTTITSVSDLWDKAVATFPTYADRLDTNHHVSASTTDRAQSRAVSQFVAR